MTTEPDRYPGRPRLAVCVVVAAAVPALAGAVLQVASSTPLTPDVLFLVVDVMVGLVYGTVAAVILSRRSHPVAWLVALAGVGGGLSALGGGWAAYASTHPQLPGFDLAIALFGSAWVPGTLALFLVVPWLVRDSALTPAGWLGVAVGTATTLALTVQRLAFPMSDNSLPLVLVVLVGLGTAASVWWRRQHGPAAERAGLGLLAAGTALMALSFVPLLLVDYADAAVLLLVPASHLACQALFPGALLVTMLRNRLWGIDLAVSRAVLAGLLTLGMVIVYAALVWAATAARGELRDRPGGRRRRRGAGDPAPATAVGEPRPNARLGGGSPRPGARRCGSVRRCRATPGPRSSSTGWPRLSATRWLWSP